MAVEDKQNNKMPKQSSFLLSSVAPYIINTRYMYYNFIPPACYLSLSPYAFYLEYTWKCCIKHNLYVIDENKLLLYIIIIIINTNEKPGKLLLKNMIKSLLVWLKL